MKCQLIQENMERWLDGNLRESVGRDFELHVKACFSCQKEFEVAKTLQNVLRTSIATIEPSPDFDAAFWRKVYARSKEPWFSKLLKNLEWTIPIPNLSQAFAVLSIAFLIGSAGGWFSASGGQIWSLNQRPASAIQTLSGFQEYKGIPSPSIAGTYLTMIEERNLS